MVVYPVHLVSVVYLVHPCKMRQTK